MAAADAVPRSRRADRAARRAFRPRRTVPAVITSIVLLAIGVLAAIEIISALLGTPMRIIPYDVAGRWANATRWDDQAALTLSSVLALLGLGLLLAALIPGRPRFVPLRTGDRDLVMGMQRRSFTRALEHAATEVDGVAAAKASMRGGRVRVTARTFLQQPADLDDAVRQAVSARLGALAPVRTPSLDVTVKER